MSRIRDVHKLLTNGQIKVSQLHEESSKIIEKTKHLNPFVTICHQESREQAVKLDGQLCNNQKPLFGIPISIKDNFCTKDILTTCSSKMLKNFVPNYTATVVSKLLSAGCIMMGKTNMDEFAMGSSSMSSHFGPTLNNWRPSNDCNSLISDKEDWYMAGGSSTGSAISVSSGSCFASLGTDTGGSTRQPASLSGIVGFKPTYGLVSRFGLIPLAHCLDVVSILARNVDDVRIVFETIIGSDDNDLTSVDHSENLVQKFTPQTMTANRIKLRIGIPEEFIGLGDITGDVSSRLDEIIAKLNDGMIQDTNTGRLINIELVKLDLKWSRFATECYTVISSAEIASNMSCFDGLKYGHSTQADLTKKYDRDTFFKANRDEGFGSEVKKRIMLGNYFLLKENRNRYLVQATKLRRCINDEFAMAFSQQKIDFILTPSTPSTSVSYKDWLSKQDENKLFHEDYFLIPSNLANLPSISLPAGLSKSGLPIGMQLIGNKFHDMDLLFISELIVGQIFNER